MVPGFNGSKKGEEQDDFWAGEWMSRHLITVEQGDSLSKCYGIMRDRRIRHLPVTDRNGVILGILSDRDLQRALVRTGDAPDLIRDESSYEFEQEATAQDYMSWPILTVSDETPVQIVASRMLREKISAFLVQDDSGRVRGILTTDDLLRLLLSLLGKTPDGIRLTLRSLGESTLAAY
jgi:acetoin utilization protein AcuB